MRRRPRARSKPGAHSRSSASNQPTTQPPSTHPRRLAGTPGGRRVLHLGDLTLRLRWDGSDGWRHYSTAAARQPVQPLPTQPPALAAADLAPTLPPDLPLRVRRYWESTGGHLALRFELHNPGTATVEIGALGIPMIFNNILTGRSLDEAHAVASFHDRTSGRTPGTSRSRASAATGPPCSSCRSATPPSRRTTRCSAIRRSAASPSRASTNGWRTAEPTAEDEWERADPWNPPTSATVAPGETRSYGVRFLLANQIRAIRAHPARRMAARWQSGCPATWCRWTSSAAVSEAPGRSAVAAGGASRSAHDHALGGAGRHARLRSRRPADSGWNAYDVRGRSWGRARLTVMYEDGLEQTIHYKVIKPTAGGSRRPGPFPHHRAVVRGPGRSVRAQPVGHQLRLRRAAAGDRGQPCLDRGDRGRGRVRIVAGRDQ